MEPLRTDEKLDIAQPRERDMDDHMLHGCSSFVFVSFASYFLAIWPYFFWLSIQEWGTLALCTICGLPAAFALGAYATWRIGIAGAAGFVGGALAVSIFLFLRFEQVFVESAANRIPPPDYPQWIQWFVPPLVVLWSLVQSAAILVYCPIDRKATKNG